MSSKREKCDLFYPLEWCSFQAWLSFNLHERLAFAFIWNCSVLNVASSLAYAPRIKTRTGFLASTKLITFDRFVMPFVGALFSETSLSYSCNSISSLPFLMRQKHRQRIRSIAVAELTAGILVVQQQQHQQQPSSAERKHRKVLRRSWMLWSKQPGCDKLGQCLMSQYIKTKIHVVNLYSSLSLALSHPHSLLLK